MSSKPDILYIMTDQQRFDTIAALGNSDVYTPNMDRLVKRGLSFTNAYSTCPVCMPARYTIRTGCEPPTTAVYQNGEPQAGESQADSMVGRCGPYLAETMKSRGYRTFGIGKFHSLPWCEALGYEFHLHSEELYLSPDQRAGDAYVSWLAENHSEYGHLEGLMGERTEMYYMPQMSALPFECGVEAWAADRAVEQIGSDDERPFFGLVSFIGPHPPFAPPIPFNRMYDPDRMPVPFRGDPETDHMDQQIPYMNHVIWAENINDQHARVLKSRYYGEISYIDHCIGRILDAVEKKGNSNNTLICFFSDHGDHLGDHGGWQKESFFDVSCRVPFLVSWPEQLGQNEVRAELTCLTDLFGIATHASGEPEVRDGADLLAAVKGESEPRESVIGYYGTPGTNAFKIMVRKRKRKYIYFANGGREQLFDMEDDPRELDNRAATYSGIAEEMKKIALNACRRPGADRALDEDGLKAFPFEKWEWDGERVYQFDESKGVHGFPERPGDVLKALE